MEACDMWLRSYSTSLYLFLYAPIALIVLFSFNAGRSGLAFQCCSVQWFGTAFGNPFIMEALGNSALIAASSAVIATLFGTLAVFGLQRCGAKVRMLFDALTYCAIIVPGIVIGISTLIAFISLFDLINPLLASWLPTVPKLNMGFFTVIAAHSLFTMALVMVIVRSRVDSLDKALLEASADLYAPPMDTFWRVTLPQISPAIMAGFLLAFTFSFDDFIIAFFVAGSETTLPIYIFSSIRRGVTPEINAISTVIICVSLALLFTSRHLQNRRTGVQESHHA
jgi:spermidine/putrescine transport system permease protein